MSDIDISLVGTLFVERGDKIELVCNATGGEQIAEDIDWFKDGNLIELSYREPSRNKINVATFRSLKHWSLVSTLVVDHAEMDDAGTYVCRSSFNKHGDLIVSVLAGKQTTLVFSFVYTSMKSCRTKRCVTVQPSIKLF